MTPFRQFLIFFYDLRVNVWEYIRAPTVRNRATCADRRPVNREKRSAILNRRQHTEFITYSLAFGTCASASKRRRNWHMARLSRPTRGLTIGQNPAWIDTIFLLLLLLLWQSSRPQWHTRYIAILLIMITRSFVCMYINISCEGRQWVSSGGKGGAITGLPPYPSRLTLLNML